MKYATIYDDKLHAEGCYNLRGGFGKQISDSNNKKELKNNESRATCRRGSEYRPNPQHK
jgi:hypothetical protein